MKEDIKDKWVAELRSGKHEQGKDRLRGFDGKLCCLGVLQGEVLGLSTAGNAYLTVEARELSGMSSKSGDRMEGPPLSDLNDAYDKTFAEIADIIEAEWKDL